MAKQTKPKAKRTQVKDLNLAQQELTTEEANKVKGGGNSREEMKRLTIKGSSDNDGVGSKQPGRVKFSEITITK